MIFIRSMDKNLLRAEATKKTAKEWIKNNGYKIRYCETNVIYVVNDNVWYR